MPIFVTIFVNEQWTRQQVHRGLPVDWDIQLTFVNSGTKLLEAIRGGLAEVVFLDLNMPGLSGMKILEQIHHEQLNSLPIITTTEIISEPLMKYLTQLGTIAFLPRPVDANELSALLHRYGLLEEIIETEQALPPPKEVKGAIHWMNELIECAISEAAGQMSTYFSQG